MSNTKTLQIAKAVQEDKRLATFVVLTPDQIDGHGDVYSEEEVEKACENFNVFCRKANLMHLQETDEFSIVQSYTAPVEMYIGDTYVKKGTWLAVTKFREDSDLWPLVKSGDFSGLSIQCLATTEPIT